MTNSTETYYLYGIFDPRYFGPFKYGDLHFELKPFYIGISKQPEVRFKDHIYEAKRRKTPKGDLINKLTKIGTPPVFKILRECIESTSIKNLEIEYIRTIGRRDLKSGPLTNLLDGGRAEFNLSPEILEKKRQKMKGVNAGKNSWMYGRRGDQTPRYGIKHTEESKKLMSQKHIEGAIRGSKSGAWRHEYKITNLKTLETYITESLRDFCIEHKINYEYAKEAFSDKFTVYKTWIFEKNN